MPDSPAQEERRREGEPGLVLLCAGRGCCGLLRQEHISTAKQCDGAS